jgi:hypothetical protein
MATLKGENSTIKNSEPILAISSNSIFLACNFNNKRVKGHFDELKKKWEDRFPIRVYLSDKVKGKGARDLWQDICNNLKESNVAIFDVTSFRPNVVLELGFALATKNTERIVICRDLTPSGKAIKKPEGWLLSDIPHLNRIEYKKFRTLDKKLLEHVELMAPVKRFYRLMKDVEGQTRLSSQAYIAESLNALHHLRDDGPVLRKEFKLVLQDPDVDFGIVEKLLIKHQLAKPDSGSKGSWKLID